METMTPNASFTPLPRTAAPPGTVGVTTVPGPSDTPLRAGGAPTREAA